MRITLITSLAFAMTLAACGKGEGGGEQQPPAATKTGAAPAAVDYGAIDKMVDAARTGDDFTNVLMACGKLELDAAAGGNGELAKDENYREHCRRRPTHLRAEMAIKESTPDKMSAHCLSATMGLEELVKDGIKAPESTELLGKVKTACGM
jgi:hypothetical protein